jgi:hypothetical protein
MAFSSKDLSKSCMGLAKPSQYAVDGTGRDGYIALNNGGLYKGYEPAGAMDFGAFREKKARNTSLASIPTKRVGYTNDGSGRDGYVL